jgi:rfaE bifunctional protein nucleotidyltransferase chain/domain
MEARMVVERFPNSAKTKLPAFSEVDSRAKILSLTDMESVAADCRHAGQKIVLAHGVYDLLHMGHVRHLEEARSHGDILFVTITADAFVNKGPGKPVFSENLRAEMLSALSVVDWVAVNDAPDAEPVLKALQPDVYVKGSDYRDAEDDVTGKISREREAVETHGGKLVFTDDITFSSSELLNRHFDVFEPQVKDFLARTRQDNGMEDLLQLIEKIASLKVLVVGDTIIDEYRYVVPMGKSPKENMIATRYESHEIFAGGTIATANHVAGICEKVDVLTSLGSDEGDEEFIRGQLRENVTLTRMRRRNSPTTRKTRFIDNSYFRKLFEVYNFDDSPMPNVMQSEFDNIIADRAASYDLVIVNDFGHGLIAPSTINLLCKRSKFLAVNAQSNSANFGFNLITRYPRADLVCIDTPEAQLAVGDKFMDVSKMVGEALPKSVDCDRFILTLGRGGCATWQRGKYVQTIPAFAKSVVDLVGAGDAFLAASAPMAAVHGTMRQVGFMGNIAGALKVGIVGHRTSIDKAALVKSIIGLLK